MFRRPSVAFDKELLSPIAVGFGLILLSLLGLPCLHAIRKREHLEPETPAPQ